MAPESLPENSQHALAIHRRSRNQFSHRNTTRCLEATPTTSLSIMTTCSVCLESLTGPYLLVDNNASCHPCFRELFIHAISSESSYPASWAGRPLIATSYGHILGPDLLAAYDAKAVEYGCPPQERVFCSRTDPPRRPEPCGQFVGKWQNSKMGACVRCKACMWYTCLRCEESFSTTDVAGTQTAIEHECDPRKQSELEARAFNGLQRGVQWQICPNPNCKRRVELSEGCNHMRCECRTHFCFVCGNYVRDGEGHWKENGGCPRFGQKGSRQAIYDDDDQFNDNEDMSDDERAQYMQRWEYDNDDHDHDVAAQLGAFDMQIQMVAQEIREQEAAEAARLAHRYPDRLDEGEAPGEPRRRRRRRRRRHREEFDDPEQVEQWQARYDALMREGRVPRYIPVHVEWDHERQHRRRGFGAFMNNAIRAVEYHFLGRSNRPHL